MTRNPAHNPLASGELITAYRMHCDALQASGINASATERLRNATIPLSSSAYDIERHFPTLKKLGINLTAEQQTYIAKHIALAGKAIAPNVQAGVQDHTILKAQRSLHGLMLQTRQLTAQPVTASLNRSGVEAHYRIAEWSSSSPTSRFTRVGWQSGCSGGDDGWDDGENLLRGDGGGDQECSDGSGAVAPQDGYDVIYTQGLLGGTIRTPSGAEIQACTAFYAILALGAGLSAGLATALGEGTILILGILFTGPALVALLTIIAALAAYLSVVC